MGKKEIAEFQRRRVMTLVRTPEEIAKGNGRNLFTFRKETEKLCVPAYLWRRVNPGVHLKGNLHDQGGRGEFLT